MPAKKVLVAFCHELGCNVTIDDARRAYFALEQKDRKRFRFSCSDRHCNVTMSGVNYHVKAEDGDKFKAAHFRSPHPHTPGCEWNQFTSDIEQDIQPGETKDDFTERKARQKLRDDINYFDASLDNDTSTGIPSLRPVNTPAPEPKPDESSNSKKNTRWSKYTKTTVLQRLIDFWQEAKNTLPHKEFMKLRIHVKGIGSVYLNRYITHIQNGLTNQYEGVIYGGGHLVRRYGRGFLFSYFDKHEEKDVSLYVDKEIMTSGNGMSNYLHEILETENVRYFRVFLLNPSWSQSINKVGDLVINLHITTVKQLVIFYELNSSKEHESTSAENDGDNPA